MVNRAMQDYVVDQVGLEAWETICAAAEAPAHYSDSLNYDDAVTYGIVGAASEMLERPASEILEGFGRYWVKFTGREGWGAVFDMAGSDLRSFVAGLDELHARVESAMPASAMPSFGVTEHTDGSLDVTYRSDRDGLAPMVVGLLNGLAEHFDESWSVDHRGPTDDGTAELFRLTPVP